MKLLDFYPGPAELISNEFKVLDYLSGDPYIADKHSVFLNDAKRYCTQGRRPTSGFQFQSYLDVYHSEMPRIRKQEPNLRLVVAVIIERENVSLYGNISYVLVVCRIRSKHPSILRKFHFDINSGTDPNRRQQQPMSHLQYCGGVFPYLGKLGLQKAQLQQLHMKLSEPRIFFWPMSLALLIDMALHEFPDPRSEKFRATSEWRGIIRASEKLLLKPFYEKCVEVIVDTGSLNRTLADEFYF